jgi:hypothetical protein
MTTEDKVKAIADWHNKNGREIEYEDWIQQNARHLALVWYVANDFVSLKEFGSKLIDMFYEDWAYNFLD